MPCFAVYTVSILPTTPNIEYDYQTHLIPMFFPSHRSSMPTTANILHRLETPAPWLDPNPSNINSPQLILLETPAATWATAALVWVVPPPPPVVVLPPAGGARLRARPVEGARRRARPVEGARPRALPAEGARLQAQPAEGATRR